MAKRKNSRADPATERERKIQKHYERKRRWNLFGNIVQVVFFLANAYVWIIAMLCILGGFMLGFISRTIDLSDFNILDFIATTPSTIFITYGLLMIILTTAGCFASSSANLIMLIIFLICVILIFVFDLVAGIWLYLSTSAFLDFTNTLKLSLQGYGIENAAGVGIFRIPPTKYWTHVQNRTKSCGVYNFTDWFDTPIAVKNWSLPDTCCNDDYEHLFCGDLLMRHPESERHSIAHIVNTEGLMRKFPRALRKAFGETRYVGLSVGITLILSFILATILLLLVAFKKYKGLGGPENKVNPYQRKEPIKHKGHGHGDVGVGNRNKRKKSVPGKQIHDHPGPGMGSHEGIHDQRKNSHRKSISDDSEETHGDAEYGGEGQHKRARTSH